MGSIILAVFLGLIAVVLFIVAAYLSEGTRRDFPGARPALNIVGGIFLLGLFLEFALGGMVTVPVKSIGVPQEFGTVSGGVMQPGIHWTFQPWLSTTNVDETVQTTSFEGANALDVRIGGQQSAKADVTIQWQIRPQAAGALFQDYAHQGNLMSEVTNAVVVREFKQVVNQELGDYNPITDVQNVSGANSATSQFTSFGPQILAQMRKDIGAQIEVKSVFLPRITYDTTVEQALTKIQQANANYAVAAENVKVNQENAQAYTKLGNPSMSQLAAECLTDLKDGMSAPTGFQCLPGSSSSLALSGK